MDRILVDTTGVYDRIVMDSRAEGPSPFEQGLKETTAREGWHSRTPTRRRELPPMAGLGLPSIAGGQVSDGPSEGKRPWPYPRTHQANSKPHATTHPEPNSRGTPTSGHAQLAEAGQVADGAGERAGAGKRPRPLALAQSPGANATGTGPDRTLFAARRAQMPSGSSTARSMTAAISTSTRCRRVHSHGIQLSGVWLTQ